MYIYYIMHIYYIVLGCLPCAWMAPTASPRPEETRLPRQISRQSRRHEWGSRRSGGGWAVRAGIRSFLLWIMTHIMQNNTMPKIFSSQYSIGYVNILSRLFALLFSTRSWLTSSRPCTRRARPWRTAATARGNSGRTLRRWRTRRKSWPRGLRGWRERYNSVC